MSEIDVSKALVAVIGFGFSGLIGVVGFFARRLVHTQDDHGRELASHRERISVHDVEIANLKRGLG